MPRARRRSISQESEMIYDAHEFGIIIDTRELFISSDLGTCLEDAMIDHRTANMFIRNLRILNNKSSAPILVHSITCGGDWNYGIAIYDAIKSSCDDENSSDIIMLSHGHARSMSSIMPQAATWRVIMPHADFLVHWGTEELCGNYTSVQAEAHWNKQVRERMIDIYIERCKDGEYWKREGYDTSEEIRSFLVDRVDRKQEFYLTPDEAVDMGFMDAVLGNVEFETITNLRTIE